jgi:nucleotide-binding universal stress UspA family protein
MNHPRVPIQRILVALDSSAHSRAALVAAAKLAVQLEAHLMGVFVEDMNLLRLAQLPFAREIRYASATPQKLDQTGLGQQLRSQADHARDELRQIAERHALEWSFRVLRGLVAAELLTAATEADLLVLGRAGRQAAPRHWLGSTARTAVAQHQHPILLMPPSYDLSQPPLLLYDGSAAAQRALLLAVTLAEKHGRLSILFLTSDATIAQQWQQTLQTQIAGEALQIEYRMVSDVTGLAAVF